MAALLPICVGTAMADLFNGVNVPGIVIAHQPASSGIYIGSPSIAVLPNGDYIASHDEFGPGSSQGTSGITRIYRSADQGETWAPWSVLTDQFWSNLFVHDGDLYILGTRHGPTETLTGERDLLIRRSTNGGMSWTTPTDAQNGLISTHPLGSSGYHTAPTPVVEHNGRLWRAVEVSRGSFRPIVFSAPSDSDLLDASNWTSTNTLAHQKEWLPNNGLNFWMEGNVVAGPDDELVNVMRISVNKGQTEKAAIVKVNNTENLPYLGFNPDQDIVEMPGAAKKFTIRYDEETESYWSLTNVVNEDNYNPEATPGGIRNIVGLIQSDDLIHWETRHILLQDLRDVDEIGFQYLDWQFDGEDIVAVSRTSFDDGMGGPANFHDSNFMTFHRIEDFRSFAAQASHEVPEPTAVGLCGLMLVLLGVTRVAGVSRAAGGVLLVVAASPTCGAAVLVSESFDYPAGNLHGRNGGVGWAAGWGVTDNDGAVTVTPTGLSFSDYPVSGGAALVQLGPTGASFTDMSAARTIGVSATPGSDLWMSFLYQQPNGPLNDFESRIAELRLNDLKLRVRPKQSNLQGAALAYDGSAFGDSDTYNAQDGQVYLMIARFGDMGQAVGDDATMWVLGASGYDAIKYSGVTEQELYENSLMILTDPHDNQLLTSGNRLQMLVADVSDTGFGARFDELKYGQSLSDVVAGIASPLLPGDFNNDLVVDAADYTVWRDHSGEPSETAINDSGDGANGVDPIDYLVWYSNYGQAVGGGVSHSVPEPASWALASAVIAATAARRTPCSD